MFGFFGKPNLTLVERAALLYVLVLVGVMTYLKHRQWLTEGQRAAVIDDWLVKQKPGHKIPALYRGKISVASTEMVRFLITTQDESMLRELFELLGSAPGARPASEVKEAVARMMKECEVFLIAKGLHD
jgi:hypothetical protein